METFNLYNGITSYVHYLSNLFGDQTASKTRILESNNIMLAKLALIQNFFLLSRKEVINKTGELAFSSKIIDEYLEELVDVAFNSNENGLYFIGGEYIDKTRLVSIIRNKFANGDYYADLKNNVIVLNTIPETIVSIQKLNALITGISNGLVKEKQVDSIDRIIIQNDINSSNIIKNEADLKKQLKKVFMKKYTLKSTNGEVIDSASLAEFYKLVGVISEYLKMGVSFDDILNSYKHSISVKHLLLEEKVCNFNDKEIEAIIKLFEQDKSFYDIKDYRIQKKKINEIMIALKSPNYNSEGFLIGTANNLLILNDVNNVGKVSADEYLSALISEFLVLYRSLFSSNIKEFDFASLDLSRIRPIKMVGYEETIKSEESELENYKKGLSLSIKELKEYETRYSSANSKEEKDYMLMKLAYKKREIEELKSLIESSSNKLNKLSKTDSKGIENKKIIEQIIYTITYGKVSIRKSLKTNNIKDCVINFSNLDGSFELNIRVEDFLELFREYNVNAINKHFNSVEKAKKKVRR